MQYTKGEWEAGYNPSVTGPTTPAFELFCGGKDWPYRTVNVGEETIAVVPAQATSRIIGQHSEPLEGSAEANAHLIAASPIGYELAEFIISTSATWIDEGLLEIGEGDYIRMKELALKFRAKAEGK